ncbi:transcription factor IIF subunit tfg1 [Malassezia sp. CBS 17886]|nr:transcription factor IIF subunit tfg1 [Malassezia sp. CBS 17886]
MTTKAERPGAPTVKPELERSSARASPAPGAGPPGPTAYRDIPLFSMDMRNMTTHIMKFAHHNRVDPNNTTQFIPPVKLNRKMPLRAKLPPANPRDPIIDRWGKPVLKDGRPLLWPTPGEDLSVYEEYVKMDRGQYGDDDSIAPGSSQPRGRLFRKRVREVHKSANAARRTRNEEFFPWVLEDFDTVQDWESARDPLPNSLAALESYIQAEKARRERAAEYGVAPDAPEVKPKLEAKSEPGAAPPSAPTASHAPWVGQLEGDSDENSLSHHVLFAFDERSAGGFKVIPVRRLYKFAQLQKNARSSDEVEEEFQRYQRSSDAGRLALRQRYNPGAGTKVARASGADSVASRFPTLSLPTARPTLGWSGSERLVAVRGETKAEPGVDNRDLSAARTGHAETTYDELDFEESFADDEERADAGVNEDDQEAKELEERLKREMVADRVDDEIKQEPDDDSFDAVAINRRSGRDALWGGTCGGVGRHDDSVLTGSGQQMRKIMKALSRREGLDVYDSDEEAKNPYASDDSDDHADLDVLHPERAIIEAREERARVDRLAKENAAAAGEPVSGAATPTKSGARSGSPDSVADAMGTKRKNDAAPPRRDTGDGVKRLKMRTGQSSRSSSPPVTRPPTALETEIADLICNRTITSTTDLVQHFRQRLKHDATLKEQLSAAVKKIAFMDKKTGLLRLKDGSS